MLLLLLTVFSLWAALPAAATTRYVSPAGTGSTCSSPSPCSLATGLNATLAGDTLILKDGTYASELTTVRSGTSGSRITIEAENKWLAILQPPLPATYRGDIVRIVHSYITIRGLKIDGREQWHFLFHTIGTATANLQSVIVEHNWIANGGGVADSTQYVNALIYRHNLIENTGNWSSSVLASNGATHDPCCGSALYVSNQGTPAQPVTNLEVYGNTFREITNQIIDLKNSAGINNAHIHHNIMENHMWPQDHGHPNPSQTGHGYNDGMIYMAAINSVFEDNILRNNNTCGPHNYSDQCMGTSVFRITGYGNNIVRDNTVYTGELSGGIIRSNNTSTLAVSEVTGNIYCGLDDYTDNGTIAPGINAHDEQRDVALSVCTAREAVILSEFAALPGYTYAAGGTQPPVISSCSVENAAPTHLIVNMALSGGTGTLPMLPASNPTGFTATRGGASWVYGGTGTRTDNDTYDLTMTTSATAGQAIVMAYAQSTGNVTETGLVEMAETSGKVCTNNVTPPPTPTTLSADYACVEANVDLSAGEYTTRTDKAGWCRVANGHLIAVRVNLDNATDTSSLSVAFQANDGAGNYTLAETTDGVTCPASKRLCIASDIRSASTALTNVLALGGDAFNTCGRRVKRGSSLAVACSMAVGDRAEFEVTLLSVMTAGQTSTVTLFAATGTALSAPTNSAVITGAANEGRF